MQPHEAMIGAIRSHLAARPVWKESRISHGPLNWISGSFPGRGLGLGKDDSLDPVACMGK